MDNITVTLAISATMAGFDLVRDSIAPYAQMSTWWAWLTILPAIYGIFLLGIDFVTIIVRAFIPRSRE